MKLIDLDKAAEQIKRLCEQRTRPFFFIVGAGISYPPILLAAEIEKHCRALAKDYDTADEPAGMSPIDGYSYWFDRAYEHPVLRQEYLRDLIEGSPISHANFRLAHLLLEKQISNLVVTPNFDDFLSRALTLFGKAHIVCDHPKTVERINPEQDDIQIIHVHGTYWFYDCCNLRDEIESRAKTSEQSNATMAFKLDEILSRRSPLVIGYSGWEGDVIMSALKRRLQGDLPYNLYWFCYKRDQVESLPDWLKHHPRVYFVIPKANPARQNVLELPLQENVSENRITRSQQNEARGYSDNEEHEPTLAARNVLDKLIRIFELKAPELTSDPLGFFADQLRLSLPQDDAEKVESNIYYSFGSVVERIERAKERENMQAHELQLEKVRDALRRSQYREAIQQGLTISPDDLNQTQLKELMAAISTATSVLDDGSTEELEGYDLVVGIGNMLLQQKVDEPILRERIAKALFRKGYRLSNLNQIEEGFGIYDELVRRFDKVDESGLQDLVARALVSKGYWLATLNRDEAIAVCDEVIKRFGETTEPGLRQQVAKALVNKGFALGNLNRSEEAVAVYDEVIKRFGEATESTLRGLVAKALHNKGYRLGVLNRSEEAIAAYEEVIKRFSEATESSVREQVSWALNGAGFEILCQAKQAWADGDEANSRLALIHAQKKINAALEYDSKNSIALGNKGYIAFLLGQQDEARELLTQAIKLGGKKIQQGELDDSRIHPLPQDEKFRELIFSIPLPETDSGN
ncbi:MAG TPA: tetratricopeptide repeat protein [Pyrinomonadaceae bacterium]|nr:tetratricopeptide repeat protein [Pyrinomonadaceae bacterium]